MADGKLFDASSVVEILIGDANVSVDVLFGEHLLDLTVYEVGNTLWKLALAWNELADETLDDAVTLLADLQTEMAVETATGSGFPAVVETARDEGLTVYDAAYLSVAHEQSLTLISEDEALRDAAGQYVSVGTVADLAD